MTSVLAAALVAGCGGGGTPHRIAPVRLVRPPVAVALVKQAGLAKGDLGALLARGDLDMRLASVTREGVTLRDVAVRRRGDRLAGDATVAEADLAQAAPAGIDLRYDPGAGGPGIALSGSKTVLGVDVPLTVRVVPENGAVVAEPQGLPVGRTVLFDDPRVSVDALSARPVAGGLRVHVDAHVP